ncbi:MAG: hypothetical protein ABI304_08160 [Rudaea sp.]
MLRLIVCFTAAALLFAGTAHAQRDFSGQTASGAYYRIAVPDSWKDGDTLILFQHGLTFDSPKPNPSLGPIAALQLSEGYAVASSSFSQRSWALFTVADDNAQLLAAFRAQVGQPGAIIPYGGSLGGLIALKLAEDPRFAPVSGVYAACPPAAGARVWDTAIDLRLAYDVVCKDAGDLPTGAQPYPWAYNLKDIPANISDLTDEARLLQTLVPLNQCTGVNLPSGLRNGAMQRRLAQLMNLAHITDEKFFVTNVGYATYALSDLLRAPDKLDGISPFDNMGVDYGDATINANIARIQGDPLASLYFHWASDFRGEIDLATKVISVQTSRDQLVIPANQYVLRQTLPANQLTSALVNEATPTHCGFSLAEGVGGWEALRHWIANDHQPTVSDIQSDCEAAAAAGADGACRYDPDIVVPSFDSQVRPRQAAVLPLVDGHYSGQWYDQQRSGEGIDLEILPDNKALVYFFTYPPAGTPGAQTWLTGVGDIVGNGIEFADMQLPSLDSEGKIVDQHWGRIGISFDDCDNATMRWDGPPAWGSLKVPLRHLTQLQNLGCGIQGTTPPSANPASGAWYDPAYYGRGFVFEQLDSQNIASVWYGFDADGNSTWLSGVLHAGSDGSFGGSLVQGLGPHFGPDYDPNTFHFTVQGDLAPTAFSCKTATAHFTAAPGRSALLPASLSLRRITTPLGVAVCTP